MHHDSAYTHTTYLVDVPATLTVHARMYWPKLLLYTPLAYMRCVPARTVAHAVELEASWYIPLSFRLDSIQTWEYCDNIIIESGIIMHAASFNYYVSDQEHNMKPV